MKCDICEMGLKIWDYPNHPMRILRDEFKVPHLTTMNGEYVIKINYCPKCGRKLEEK